MPLMWVLPHYQRQPFVFIVFFRRRYDGSLYRIIPILYSKIQSDQVVSIRPSRSRVEFVEVNSEESSYTNETSAETWQILGEDPQ